MAKIEVGSCSSWFLVHKILPPWFSRVIYQSPAAVGWLKHCRTWWHCMYTCICCVYSSQEQSHIHTHTRVSLLYTHPWCHLHITFHDVWCHALIGYLDTIDVRLLLACRYHWCQWQYLCSVTQLSITWAARSPVCCRDVRQGPRQEFLFKDRDTWAHYKSRADSPGNYSWNVLHLVTQLHLRWGNMIPDFANRLVFNTC